MSRNVSVVVNDDLDGSEGAETVIFGFDGVTYEIDLAARNRAELSRVFEPFIAAGRKAQRRSRSRGAGRTSGPSADRSDVRAWAREAGLQVSERGRISSEVLRQYEASHQGSLGRAFRLQRRYCHVSLLSNKPVTAVAVSGESLPRRPCS